MTTSSTEPTSAATSADNSDSTKEGLADEEVRRRIGPWEEDAVPSLDRFDERTNFLVRAAAGSGKTTALVARMVALVRRGHPVEDLAAITFTRKAAGEMTARFYKELQQIAPKLEGQEKENVLTALQNLHGTYIGTIHGFCGRLLREHALAAELPPDFSVGLEGRDEAEMRDRAWQAFLSETYAERPEVVERLQDLGVELEELGPFFETLCKYPELELHTDSPPDVPDLSGAVREARAVLKEWQPRRPEVPTKDRDDVQKAFDRAEAMLKHHPLDRPAQQAKFLGFFEGAYSESSMNRKLKVGRWNDEGGPDPEVLRDEVFPRLVEEVIRPDLRSWQAHVHERLAEAVRPAVDTYREMRKEEGRLTHHDVLLLTRNLLRDDDEARAQAQRSISHLLVDEFQDTDPLQAQILFYLTSEDPVQDNWRECVPRPGSLFIVGDDKQSIYRFRRADKAVFDEVTKRLKDLEKPHGEVVDLVTNFRSYGALLKGWNDAFRDIFSEPGLEDLQAKYTDFAADRPDGEDRTGLRQLPVEGVKYNWAKDIAPKEAPKIARYIDEAVAAGTDHELAGPKDGDSVFPGGAAYEDFLVLTRKKGRLPVYAEALARRGIPYTITGAEDLDESPELSALAGLLECALKPDEPVSTVGYLRGLLGGLTDGELYRVRHAYDEVEAEAFTRLADTALAERLTERLEDPLSGRVTEASELLHNARHHLQSRRPGPAIEKIIGEGGLSAASAHPPNTGTATLRAGRMLRVLSYVRQRAEEGQDWAEILEALWDIIDGEEEVESITLDTGRDNAVRVMNVHQAKGLEAPVVFLADPYSRASDPDPTHHVRRDQDVEDLVAPVVEGEGYYKTVTYAPLGWHEGTDPGFLEEEKRHQEAEEKRLLYVAATRAENLLVVSRYESKPESGPWSDLYPYFDEKDVPELSVLEETPSEEAPEPTVALGRRTEREDRLAPLRVPSYSKTSVTEHKDGRMSEDLTESEGIGESEGYGGEFGTAVHELLEKAVRAGVPPTSLPEAHVERALEEAEAEVTAEKVGRARRMLQAFAESGLPEALEEAEEVFVEYPIAAGTEESDLLNVVTGEIDLLYRDGAGWHLVDYKTDLVSGAEMPGEIGEGHPYFHQVRTYAELWEDHVGESLASARLWFADENRFVDVPLGA
jgi:ATP-dependent helicase/nuclease subunit A